MPKNQRPPDEIAEDINESLKKHGVKDDSLLKELILTFAHYLGLEKARIEKSHYVEQERERYKNREVK